MLISVHYPIVDARSFVENEGGRLPRPRWPAPDQESEFVRGFGKTAIRLSGGASIGGEHRHCDARRAVRFAGLGLGTNCRCAFRRFYSDGQALAKFEIGIVRRTSGIPVVATVCVDAIHEQLVAISELELRPRAKSRSHSRTVAELAPMLADAYLKASTAHLFGEPTSWWVQAGAPVVLVTYRAEDQLVLPPELQAVDVARASHSVTLGHWWQASRGKFRRVWFVGHAASDYFLARQLRIDLIRWHCEYESLRIVLKHIACGRLAPKPRSEFSHRLQRYLNDAITTVLAFRTARRGMLCETSCRLVEAATAAILHDDTASLATDLELQLRKLDVRPNIRRKVRSYAAAAPRAGATPMVQRDARRHLILFLAANPHGTDRLYLDEECAGIERELSMTAARERFDIRSKWAVTVDDMMRHLANLTPTVIHFSGHGQGEPDPMTCCQSRAALHRDVAATPGAGIYLEDESRQPRYVSARALALMIASTSPSARVVVLNACFSDALAKSLCEVVECVVGIGGAIDDESARAFSVSFYRALGNRNSVANAVTQATAALAAKQLRGEHLPACRTRAGVDADRIVLAQCPELT